MGKKKVLIVEDNEMNLKLYQYSLKSVDADFEIAKDGNEAVDKILNGDFDLVILDIQIPGMSGMDVAKKVREKKELSDLILIAVTAYSMKGDKEKILDAGCNYYLSKPIDTRKFPEIINELLEGKKLNI